MTLILTPVTCITMMQLVSLTKYKMLFAFCFDSAKQGRIFKMLTALFS